MTVTRQKKSKKWRGQSTHGWGSRKKHRGAGNRGGRGMAGSGKRADQRKTQILKLYGNAYFGKRGFKIPEKDAKKRITSTLNIQELPDQDRVDLTARGIQKLLAKGTPKRKYTIVVASCSQQAKEKIEKAGGSIVSE